MSARCDVCGRPHGRVRVGVEPPLHVSVTRSGPLLGVAVCADGPVGIDIESSLTVGAAPVADVALTPSELARYRRLPATERASSLTRLWARKEAVLKALGAGLDLEPSRLDLGEDGRSACVLGAPAPRSLGRQAAATGSTATARGATSPTATAAGAGGQYSERGDPGIVLADLDLDPGIAGSVAFLAAGGSDLAEPAARGLVVRVHDGAAALAP
ncbi:4'-phosphopantetheinyl transferase superfamily protein [Georgenia sp. SYP-B2076]|uniref:4'-phosphopantetheinyl transferase family protein n=1 Tax=Georgenia sp. SYP-B2076 TaxID=2495881 RepID=UPI0013E039A7|nr:4'-phosphopantetheinyl transferase superfamily protein [Georgenia sp. SYP-B2076]